MKRLLPIATATLMFMPSPRAADAPAAETPPSVRSAINLHLELHNLLMVESGAEDPSRPEYATESRAYRQARELIKDRAAWRYITDAIVSGPDMDAIVAKAADAPGDLPGPEREAVKKILSALGTAWPRFEAQDATERNRSLQNILVRVLRKQFNQTIEPRVMPPLYRSMGFRPLDAPITVYPVIGALEVGVWGKTADGYYLVVPVARRPNMMIIEGLIHELTHLIDANQPAGSHTFLSRLREKGRAADPEALEAFVHGLVAWNAGDLIRRYVTPDYRPAATVSPSLAAQIHGYLPTYEGPWTAYVDGRLTADQAIDAMVSSLRPASASGAGGAGSD